MQLAVESLGRWNHESRSHNSRTKTPFSSWILVYACAAEGLRKRARVVARDDVKPPSNTGYKSIITPLIGMLLVYRPETRGRVAPEGGGPINQCIK